MLDDPFVQAAVHGGIAPFVAALVVGAALGRTRLAWIAIVAGYATMIALAVGFAFDPLTAARKIVLLILLAALVGLVYDAVAASSRNGALALAGAAGAGAVWAVSSVLAQKTPGAMWGASVGIAIFAALLAWLVLELRSDGLRTGAAGLALGLATGVGGLMSASIGYFLGGVSIAAAAGAMLLVHIASARTRAPGALGGLTIAVACALFAAGALMLAQLPWYALPALLIVPLAARLPAPERLHRLVRAALLSLYTLVAASVPIGAAWIATRLSSS
ncbi:MAG: hypothetical protein IT518_01020 [Burkholderiales bacterium]|nr:hypothetical protein [Burkholderiales bacterium]